MRVSVEPGDSAHPRVLDNVRAHRTPVRVHRAQLRHRITPKLYGGIIAQFQNSTYYGGTIDNDTDKFYLVGLNLQYRFTPNFSADVGYNYDKLDSQIGNSYDRNRVYIGVTGSY